MFMYESACWWCLPPSPVPLLLLLLLVFFSISLFSAVLWRFRRLDCISHVCFYYKVIPLYIMKNKTVRHRSKNEKKKGRIIAFNLDSDTASTRQKGRRRISSAHKYNRYILLSSTQAVKLYVVCECVSLLVCFLSSPWTSTIISTNK